MNKTRNVSIYCILL